MAHASESQHWYYPDGRPAYEVARSDGKGMRSTTLGDARKLGLFVGVSTILGVKAKPQLVNWLIDQALDSALTLPRLEFESLDTFKQRALQDSREQARKARDTGKAIHTAIENALDWKPYNLKYKVHVEKVLHVLEEYAPLSQWQSEITITHLLGYGGKMDASVPGIIVDFKCKDFDDPTKKLAWDEHGMQLAAYDKEQGNRLINIFVSTKIAGLVVVHEWRREEILRLWEMFVALLHHWQADKGYKP